MLQWQHGTGLLLFRECLHGFGTAGRNQTVWLSILQNRSAVVNLELEIYMDNYSNQMNPQSAPKFSPPMRERTVILPQSSMSIAGTNLGAKTMQIVVKAPEDRPRKNVMTNTIHTLDFTATMGKDFNNITCPLGDHIRHEQPTSKQIQRYKQKPRR